MGCELVVHGLLVEGAFGGFAAHRPARAVIHGIRGHMGSFAHTLWRASFTLTQLLEVLPNV